MSSTPFSYRQYPGNGATVDFSVPFPYLLKAHVKVYIGYSLLDGTFSSELADGVGFNWTSATQIQLATPPTAGQTVTVIRQTPTESRLVDWSDGSNLIAADLDTADLQNLYVVQEQADKTSLAVATAGEAVAELNDLTTYGENYLGALAEDPAAQPGGGEIQEGNLYYNTTTSRFRVFGDGLWSDGAAPTTLFRWKKVAVGGETSLSGGDDNGQELAYTADFEQVYVNGTLLVRGVEYTAINGTSITGLTALTAGDVVEVISFNAFTIGVAPTEVDFTGLAAANQPIDDSDLFLLRQGTTNKKVTASVFRTELAAGAEAAQAQAEAAVTEAEAAQAAAQAAQGGAENAQAAAEAARDSAIIQAGLYPDEPTGRAAVADGEDFRVQGNAEIAAYEYRRVDANTSTLIATYPAADAVVKPKWAGKINGWPDPFFREFSLANASSFYGRNRWWGGTTAWSIVDNTIFNGKALRRQASADLSPLSGPVAYFDEFGVAAGDVFTINLLVAGDGLGVRLYARTRSEAGSFVGIQQATPYATASLASPVLLSLQVTADAGATNVALYFADNDPAKSYDIVALWLCKGPASGSPSWPTVDPNNFFVSNAQTRLAQIEPTLNSIDAWKTTSEPVVDTSAITNEYVKDVIYPISSASAETAKIVIDGIGFSNFSRGLPFTGWGARFATPVVTAFNVIRVVTMRRLGSTPKEARWHTLNVVVRAGVTDTHVGGSTVVAVGSAKVNPELDTLENIDIILRDPNTGACKTLTPGELSSEYFVGVYARAFDGGLAACGEPRGTNPNWINQSYYITNQNPLTATWADYTADGPIGFQFKLLATTTVAIDGTGFSGVQRGLPFTGWGARFAPVANTSFNTIRVISLIRSGTTVESEQARTVNVVIRAGSGDTHLGGTPVVAVGTAYVDPVPNIQANIDIRLRDPSTNEPKTLTAADLGSEYFIGIYTRNSSGGGASCGEPRGTNPNWINESYYITNQNPLTATWADYTADGPIGFQSLLVLDPVESIGYALFSDVALNPQATTASNVSYSNTASGLAADNAQEALDELSVSVGELSAAQEALSDVELIVPPVVYGLEGQEVSVYFDNLVPDDIGQYLVDVSTSSGNVGRQQNERWQWVSSGALSGGTLTISLHDKKTGALLKSVTAARHSASASSGGGLTPKVMVIGDSLINAGIITQTLLDNSGSDVMGVALYGTRGTAPNLHEGRGGWTINSYTSAVHAGGTPNPFWDGSSANFPWYLQQNGYPSMDWVVIQLGINDCFGQSSDAGALSVAQAAFIKLDGLIASIKSSGASTKVGLMIPSPPSSDQDSFGANYTTSQVRWRFKRNILIWARELIAKYQGMEADRIYIIPSNTALDTVNNMARASAAPVNSRSSVTVQRQSNGVHPAAEGYRQLGDALWAFLKYQSQ